MFHRDQAVHCSDSMSWWRLCMTSAFSNFSQNILASIDAAKKGVDVEKGLDVELAASGVFCCLRRNLSEMYRPAPRTIHAHRAATMPAAVQCWSCSQLQALASAGFKQHHQRALESWQAEAAAAAEHAAHGPEGAVEYDSEGGSGSEADSQAGFEADAQAAASSRAGSGSDASADTGAVAVQLSDAALQPPAESSAEPLDAVEREAGCHPAAAEAGSSSPAADGQPAAGDDPHWAALSLQREGGDAAAASSSHSGRQQDSESESESDSDADGGFDQRSMAAPPSTTATARSRRRRQDVGPQDVQRLVASKRQASDPSFSRNSVHPCVGAIPMLALGSRSRSLAAMHRQLLRPAASGNASHLPATGCEKVMLTAEHLRPD